MLTLVGKVASMVVVGLYSINNSLATDIERQPNVVTNEDLTTDTQTQRQSERRQYLLFSFGLLIEAVDEDLGQVVQLREQLIDGLRLARLVPRVNLDKTGE
jgi:hypothetical protein